MTATTDVSLIEGYLKSITGDREALAALVRARPGQYSRENMTRALKESGLTYPRARTLSYEVEVEAERIAGWMRAIADSLDRMSLTLRKAIVEAPE